VGDPIAPPTNTAKAPIVLPTITHTGTAFGSEYVQGNTVDNVLATGGGNRDSLDGGKGNDTYIIYSPSISIRDSSFQGQDTVYSGAYSYTLSNFLEIGIMLETAVILNAGFLDNYLEGNDLDNSINAKGGDDVIAAWGGDDLITGGKHNDVIDGGLGIDTAVFAGNLANFLIVEQADGSVTVLDRVGTSGMDQLTNVGFLQFADQTIATPDAIVDPTDGLSLAPLSHPTGFIAPAVTVSGSTENYESISGTNGVDVLWGGGGHTDQLLGGLGDDFYIATHSNTNFRDYTGSGDDTLITYATSLTTNEFFETIYMMYGAISFSGTNGDNTIYGNDHINIISAGAGDDVVLTYAGDDQVDGDYGDDSYIIESSSTRVQECSDRGDDAVYSYATTFTTTGSIETFYMMYGALDLTTGNGANTVYDNMIHGQSGNDIITGAEGDDELFGGSGSDTAIFLGDQADFDITYLGGTTLELSDNAGGGQGVDTATDFEFLQFNDGTVDALSFYI
jgi:Ca2+-binding RTX toxin-like protein